MSIEENIRKYRQMVEPKARLIAVSKTKPIEDLQAAYAAGQRLFGENKAQEMRDKHAALPKDIRWHFIGHLQTNKVKYIAPFAAMIHSVDSLKLLSEIDKEAKKNNRTIDCLLQVDIAHEDTKFGLSDAELSELLSSEEFARMDNVRICGLMGIGSITDDREQTRREFRHLAELHSRTKQRFFQDRDYFCELSLGMSHDFGIALEEGSTMVRIGSSIFGLRHYATKD